MKITLKKLFLGTVLITGIGLSMSTSKVFASQTDGNHKKDNIQLQTKEFASSEINTMVEEMATDIANANEKNKPMQIESVEMQKIDIVTQLSNSFNALNFERAPQYDKYKYDEPTIKYAYLRGYAGGQPTTGYTRNTGDQLYWNKSGGPTVSVSVSFGWKAVSVGASLGTGNSSGVGSGFRVPSYGRWKVYSDLTYKVSQPNVWGHPYNSPEGTWVRVDASPTKTYYGDNTRLIKQ